MKKVICIVGPTGSGKTKLSIELAKIIGAEIINGDSVQVYKGLDIGSAKIKDEEMDQVKHHLLSVRDVEEKYSVFDFQKDCRQKIEEINVPMIVGGTGLYIKAALYDYEFIEHGRSAHFEEEKKDIDTQDLYAQLLDIDPLTKVDSKNRRRILRALEQAIQGLPRSSKTKKDIKTYETLILYLDLEKPVLEQRLRKRLDKQIDDGFIEEVKDLYERNVEINAIGYRELLEMIKGDISLDEAKEKIIIVSRQLAKKQKTWFKNQMQVVMLDALSDDLKDQALTHIHQFLEEKSS